MAKTAQIRARVEPAVKAKAEKIMSEMGLTPTAVISMLYRQIIRERALPFEPNALTREAMRDTLEGRNLEHHASIEDLLEGHTAEA